MPRIEPYRRFGPLNPQTLIIALRGAFPQRVEKSWFGYPSFREMSQLEFLAKEATQEIGDEVARFPSLHEWVKSITIRFIEGHPRKLVYTDATGAVVNIGDGDKASFPVVAHEVGPTYQGGRAVVMPDEVLPIYGMAAVEKVQAIIQQEGGDRIYCFAFSKNASCFVETLSKRIQFAGAVICSGVDPPTERDKTPRLPIQSIVMFEEKPYRIPFASSKETAEKIHALFSAVGDSVLWEYPGKHRWPAELNGDILRHFGMEE